MKKLFLALVAVGSIATANAQLANSILVYGNAGYHSNNGDINAGTAGNTDDNYRNWNVNPGVGYQFNKNWTVGLQFGFSSSTSKPDGDDRTANNVYNVGPFVRYSHYIMGSNTFFWFGQANVNFSGGYTTHGGDPSTNKYNGVEIAAMPALGINVGKHWALNFSVGGIGFSTVTPDGGDAYHSFDVSFGQQVNFGISKNFGCGMAHHKMHGHHEPGDDMHKMNTKDDDDDAPKAKKKKMHNDDEE